MKKLLLLAISLLACLPIQASEQPLGAKLRGYFIGNSLTRGLSLDRLAKLFDAAGGSLVFGSQTGAGVNLDEHLLQTQLFKGEPMRMGFLDNKGENYSDRMPEKAVHKDYKTALQNESWDFLCLQPYLSFIEAGEFADREKQKGYLGDRKAIDGLVRYALGDNPAKHRATGRFFIYAAWPRLSEGIESRRLDPDKDGVASFKEFYDAPYEVKPTAPSKTIPTRDGVNKLFSVISSDNPELGDSLRLIPAGAVLSNLDEKIRQGKLPGVDVHFKRNKDYYLKARLDGKADLAAAKFPFNPGDEGFDAKQGVKNFYCDNVHMNDQPHNGPESGTIGAFAAAATVYATVTGLQPAFPPATVAGIYEKFDAAEDAALIAAIQESVWETVISEPLTRVKP